MTNRGLSSMSTSSGNTSLPVGQTAQLLRRASLSALQCFECAARHLNFTRAADELMLTQSAISHRIRALEEQLGYALFLRTPRQLSLTDEGRRLFEVIHAGLGRLYDELDSIDKGSATGRLVIGVVPTFARHFLVPRLADFHRQYPHIQLRIRVRASVLDFNSDPVDAAIYYDEHPQPGVLCQPLFAETLTPVCSRRYADEQGLWETPAALAACRFLHDVEALHPDAVYDEWLQWLTAAGLEIDIQQRCDIFNHFDLTLAAAMNQVGVAMGRGLLAAPRLNRGELVQPFALQISSRRRYFFLCGKENAERPRIRAFHQWLLEQVAATPKGPWTLLE